MVGVLVFWGGVRTKHYQLSWIAVLFSDHVGPYTHVHPSVALARVRDHQLASSDLCSTENKTLRSLNNGQYCKMIIIL